MQTLDYSIHNQVYINHMKSKQPHYMNLQHYHDGYEIYLQVEGNRCFCYKDKEYEMSRGTLVFLEPFQIHCSRSKDDLSYERYALNFHEEDLACIYTEPEIQECMLNLHSCIIQLSEEDLQNILFLLTRIEKEKQIHKKYTDKKIASIIMLIISELADKQPSIQLSTETELADTIKKAITYIKNHYQENINVDSVSDHVLVSKYHFSRMFKEATGSSIMKYIQNQRVYYANNLLENTDINIYDIALQTGFSSYINLERAIIKAFGKTPHEIRKQTARIE